jgi:predicted AlkP superfamily phosphohydrolase/phosphomutase
VTVVVLGIDALDPDLVDPDEHPHLTLEAHRPIETLVSSSGEPSTHELWPTIITGLPPAEHGLVLDDGVTWENPLIAAASSIAEYVLPNSIQTRLGGWLLTNTDADAFRTPATYYPDNDIETVFDEHESKAIGIPNYVVDPDTEDREHQLRRHMGELFKRDPTAQGGHTSTDPETFYEQCLEMAMIRIARVRRSIRGKRYELVFGYTSGLDLIGHVSYDRPVIQQRAYEEIDQFVGEIVTDLRDSDELLLVSDHGLQNGLHTDEAMVASTTKELIDGVSSVTDIRQAVETELRAKNHIPDAPWAETDSSDATSEHVAEQLEDLGYM